MNIPDLINSGALFACEPSGAAAEINALHRARMAEAIAERDELRETLRDRFAMAALTGIVEAVTAAQLHSSAQTPPDDIAAGWAYCFADAMLAARKPAAKCGQSADEAEEDEA